MADAGGGVQAASSPAVAVDGRSLNSEQAAGRALSFGSDSAHWILQHNREIGFTSNPSELFQTVNGIKSITQMGTELTSVGYTGSYDRNTIISVYASTTGGAVNPYSPAPANPGGSNDGRGGHITDANRQGNAATGSQFIGPATNAPTTPVVGGLQIAGNPWQWLKQNQSVLGVPVPGWLLAGGVAYFLMGRRRR